MNIAGLVTDILDRSLLRGVANGDSVRLTISLRQPPYVYRLQYT